MTSNSDSSPGKAPSLEDLCDYARGLGDDRQRSAVEGAIEREGSAGRALRAFTRLASPEDLRLPDESISPGFDVSDAAAAALRASRSLAGLRRVPLAEGVQELARETSGLRSMSSSERRLRVRSKGVVVELLVDQQSEQEATVVIGEIFEDQPELPAMGDVPVVLQDEARVLASLRSQRDGEFQADVRTEGRLTLSILLPQGDVLRIPLLDGSPLS